MKNQKGQVLLIIVLVMAVALTVALAVISRSLTDIKISRQEEISSRVFSVAEAGIERSIKIGSPVSPLTIGNITATVETSVQGGGTTYIYPKSISEGEVHTVWLVDHDVSGNFVESTYYTANSIIVCWEDTDPETAIEAAIFYKEATDGKYKVARGAYDSQAAIRGNSFDSPDGDFSGCPDGFGRKKALTFSDFGIAPQNDILLFLRIRPFYNGSRIAVVGVGGGGGVLPGMGTCFVSTAVDDETKITRKAQQCKFHQSPPEIFDYALFSEENLVK